MISFLFSLGWVAVVIAAIIALFLIIFLIYLFARIFTDEDTASKIAVCFVACPLGAAIGCACPGVIFGLLSLWLFQNFAIGVVIGGITGLIVAWKIAID